MHGTLRFLIADYLIVAESYTRRDFQYENMLRKVGVGFSETKILLRLLSVHGIHSFKMVAG